MSDVVLALEYEASLTMEKQFFDRTRTHPPTQCPTASVNNSLGTLANDCGETVVPFLTPIALADFV